MSDMLKNTYRGYLIDHHSPAPPIVNFNNLNPAEYASFFEEADITNIMVYCKDHWGYSYYDTKIGTKHPGLKIDYVKELRDICTKKNIEFTAYYSVEYDTLAAMQHPEWSIRDVDGTPIKMDRCPTAKWRMTCFETDYRLFMLNQLAEIVKNYKPDSLFLDIFGKSLCYCDKCKKLFKERFHYDLPEKQPYTTNAGGIFDFGEQGRDVNLFLEEQGIKMLNEIKVLIKNIDPTIKLTINLAALYPKKFRDILDYHFTEPWAGDWFSAIYARDTSINQYPLLGPGDVSEIYNYSKDSVYQLASSQIAAGGCRVFLYSESQHPDGTLEHLEAHKVGKAFKQIEEIEPYLKNREPFSECVLIQSEDSIVSRCGNEVYRTSGGRYFSGDLHRKSILGAMKLLDYEKLAWKIMPEQEVTYEKLKKFNLVVLAGTFHINNNLKQSIEKYVENGGNLISDASCGLYNMDGTENKDFTTPNLFGCNIEKKIDLYKKSKFGSFLKSDGSSVFKYIPDTFMPLGRELYGVKPSTGIPMGNLHYPCTEITDTKWVCWGYPPPSMKSSKYPVLIKNKFGNGVVYYTSFELFGMMEEESNLNYQLFHGIIEDLLPNPIISLETEYPGAISCQCYVQKDKLLVHVISNLATRLNGETPTINVGKLKLSCNFFKKPIAKFLNDKDIIECFEKNKYWILNLGELKIHKLLIIKFNI